MAYPSKASVSDENTMRSGSTRKVLKRATTIGSSGNPESRQRKAVVGSEDVTKSRLFKTGEFLWILVSEKSSEPFLLEMMIGRERFL